MATLREVEKRIRILNCSSLTSTSFCVITLLAVSSINGFDGYRKGFVLGGGLGFTPYSSWSGDGTFGAAQVVEHFEESGSGPGINFMIGHAWDERNMIVFEVNGAGWKSDLFPYEPKNIAQGTHGAVWYHYFGAPGRSIFTSAGLVLYRFANWNSSQVGYQELGPGLLLGGGYEFARHWQIGGYWGTGYKSERSVDWSFSNINILVSAVAF